MRYYRVKIHKASSYSTEFFVRAKNAGNAKRLAKLQRDKIAEESWDLVDSKLKKIDIEDLGSAEELEE